ncbi:MerR family transcriptional regulator [Agrilactobacillus yilanensis]|uniref:MerR family transcriptional regulator n=1 Tax=Agrilactobacillus yilanensis TaxID=2485997 RepID=A0ABW4J6P7_9LACO|nr:MerR family transcriptional regulator [Agrilactobacillus yilanensis]
MNIKKAAELFDVPTDDLRYYERIGLTPEVKRTVKGNRDYSTSDLNWIYLVKSLRQLGISDELLIDFATLSKLAVNKDVSKAQTELLIEESNELENQIIRLKNIKSLLTYRMISSQLQNKHDENVAPIWE